MIGACAALAMIAVIALVAHRLRPSAHRPVADREHDVLVNRSGTRRAIRSLARVRRRVARLWMERRGVPADDIAAWCDDLGRRVRSGSTLREALQHATPPADSLRRATEELRHRLERGASLEEACAPETRPPTAGTSPLRRGGGRPRDDRHLGLALAVIRAAGEHGGSTAQALDRVAGALRLRAADEQERSAHSAQARLSAHVLTAVPMVFLAVVATIDSSVRAIVASPAGLGLTAAGFVLNASGWLWMRAIVGAAR